MVMKYYKTFDILKYILAMLVVSAHCGLFEERCALYEFYSHVTECAVPTFFSLSAYLFYSRIQNNENGNREILMHVMKRLSILYIIWIVLMLPISIPEFFMKATWKELLYAIPFRSSFGGYWFIKALVINTALVYLFRKHLWVCSILSTIVYLFFAYDYMYGNISDKIHPYYTFFYHTYAFSFGALIAKYSKEINQRVDSVCPFIIALVSMFALSFIVEFRVISKLAYPILLTLLALKIKIDVDIEKCKAFRNDSILYYMLHFSLIYMLNHIFTIQVNSILRFLMIYSFLVGVCAIIRECEKIPQFSFLRYLR